MKDPGQSRENFRKLHNCRVIMFPPQAPYALRGWELVQEKMKEMFKKIYVGNLSYEATEKQVSEMFAQYGKIESIAMITDRDSGRFRGFGFVEMEDSAANAAIKALNDTELDGRKLRVNEARPREKNSNRGPSNVKFPHSGGGNF